MYKVKFRQASNHCIWVLEDAKLAYFNNGDGVLNKCLYAIPSLFNGSEVLTSVANKAKLFAENLSKNSSLDNSGISFPGFLSRTNLRVIIRIWQLAYVIYECMPTYTNMDTLTCTLIFSLWFLKFSNFFGSSFLVLVLEHLNAIYLMFNLFVRPWKRQILYFLHLF